MPSKKVLVREGQDGRLLLGGRWYFRQDDLLAGETSRWYAQRDLTGWSAIRVPHSWNATDLTQNRPTWRLVPQGVPAAPGPEGTEAGVEDPLRGLELPHHRVAERQEDRRLHRLLPLRARTSRGSARAQQPRGPRVHAAQPHRPHALAAGRLQRLRLRGLVELRRPAARGVRPPGGHRGRGAGPGPPPRFGSSGAGARGGAHDAAQPHCQGPQRRAGAPPDGPGRGPEDRHEARDRARRRPASARHPRDHPQAEALAARPPRALRAERVRGPRAEGQAPHGPGSAAPARGHLPAQLRGQEARVAGGACSTSTAGV